LAKKNHARPLLYKGRNKLLEKSIKELGKKKHHGRAPFYKGGETNKKQSKKVC
jgi:hypothetical protein